MGNSTDVIKNYFTDFTNNVFGQGTVVECGTAQGTHEPSRTLEYNYGWKTYGFECDPKFYPLLEKNRPNAIKLNYALSNKNGVSEFTQTAHGGNSSLKHCDAHIAELKTYDARFAGGSPFKTIKVPTITWNTFIHKYNLDKVDLLILDVEGAEMTILDSFSSDSILPQVIKIEYSYSDPQNKFLNKETKENFSGLIIIYKKLLSLGYQFDYVESNDAFFSLKTFWKEKPIPSVWQGESQEFTWINYTMYDKNKFRKMLKYL
tara:strand:+ start:285 stop:1067 length:783 start_codon:yes stop_codon:yes gene_type:complete